MSEIIQDVARERLLDQVFDARTFVEIMAARKALPAWIDAHPDEPGMSDAFEILSHRAEMANEQKPQPLVKKPAAVR